MDFCEAGDLAGVLEKAEKERKPLSEDQIMTWFAQAMLALKYLHEKHILHRDLKPGNFFITKKGDLKLGDFGIAKALSSTVACVNSMAGTPYYLAPEVVQEKPYGLAADVWSMGVVFFQMCALKVPFDANNLQGLVQKIIKGVIPRIPSQYSDALRQLCNDMMCRDPKQRIGCKDVVQRPLVQGTIKAMLERREKAIGNKGDDEEKTTPKWEVLDQFAQFDRNGDGVIDRNELGQVLRHLDSAHWSPESVDRLLAAADCNKDGKIQFDEFVQWIFGGNEQESLAVKSDKMIQSAQQAADAEDLPVLKKSLTRWRQAVDFGYLRVSPPAVCEKTCQALSWLALSTGSFLGEASKRGEDARSDCLVVVRQMRAILHAVETLLAERSRQYVRRIGAVCSRVAVNGLCFELIEGTRLGNCPGGLDDASLKKAGVQWEALQDGEYVIEATGTAVDPCRQDSPLVEHIILSTNQGRKIELGKRASTGKPFAFKAGAGEQIEELVFAGGTCTEARRMPFVVGWTDEKLKAVRMACEPSAKAVVNALLQQSWRCGAQQGKHALLQARRLGIADPFIPTDVKEERLKHRSTLKPPSHWDAAEELEVNAAVKTVDLKPLEITALQKLLTASFSRLDLRSPETSLVPTGLELVKGVRIQNWQCWSGFRARSEEIQRDIEPLREQGISLMDSVPDLKTAVAPKYLEGAGYALDPQTNCVWLYHGISPEAAEEAIKRKDFDVDQTGREEGKLYGRGIYFAESCGHADELSPAAASEDHCLLLCRVALGNLLYDDAVLPDTVKLVNQCVGGPYHSVLGDREKRCPDAYRKFVVYDKDQVYPEFLLWYKRVYGSRS
eukprot:gnl/TRDRNA2_/TRDRNA2_130927_c0_seq1.p1 gnl/TRDRNA2_/TRDRNA2_130927_c0~~gnl/TRDRNA2_/TRDRNA2_130927_c0_seq1.p1  ORF type:complete len:854 (-),score=169.08 gnl/TRDRNA2_/TRDRNA2_130927_c0_seq1:7-2529(-)